VDNTGEISVLNPNTGELLIEVANGLTDAGKSRGKYKPVYFSAEDCNSSINS